MIDNTIQQINAQERKQSFPVIHLLNCFIMYTFETFIVKVAKGLF